MIKKSLSILLLLTVLKICHVNCTKSSKPCARHCLDTRNETCVFVCSSKLGNHLQPLLFLDINQASEVTYDYIQRSFTMKYKVILSSKSSEILDKLKTKLLSSSSPIPNPLQFLKTEKIRFYFNSQSSSDLKISSNWTDEIEVDETGQQFVYLSLSTKSNERAQELRKEIGRDPSVILSYLRCDLKIKGLSKLSRNKRLWVSSKYSTEGSYGNFKLWKSMSDRHGRKFFIRSNENRSKYTIDPLLFFDTFGPMNLTFDSRLRRYKLKYKILLKSSEVLLAAKNKIGDENLGNWSVVFRESVRLHFKLKLYNDTLNRSFYLRDNWVYIPQNANVTNVVFLCYNIQICEQVHFNWFNNPESIQRMLRIDLELRSINKTGARKQLLQNLAVWPVVKEKFVLMQRRFNDSLSFKQTWTVYESGFGSEDRNFWLGLKNIHLITRLLRENGKCPTLRIEMEAFSGEVFWSEYGFFYVGPASTDYNLESCGFYNPLSTAGDSMKYNEGRRFSTYDEDHTGGNYCSVHGTYGHSGWWHGSCTEANPNGIWRGSRTNSQSGIYWQYLDGYYSMRSMSMTIRFI